MNKRGILDYKDRLCERIIASLCLSILLPVLGRAQVTVKAEIDSAAILIGQQAHVSLKVTTAKGAQVIMPVFPNKQMVKGVEVLNEKIIATEDLNNGLQTSQTKQFTITSFDSSFYYLPPFKVKVNNKVYSSNSLALKVVTLDVDTLHLDRFFGPKPNAEVPFSWKDWRGIFYLSLLLIILLAFASYIAIQLHNHRPLLRRFRLRPALPPHVWAIKEIEKLNSEKLNIADTKQYYSDLTDVIRSYIQRRYGFSAREMTSTEIINRLTAAQDLNALDELRQLFLTADLAKFAKLQTQLSENDENLLRAMNFINATKLEEKEAEHPKPVVPKEVKRTDRNRLALKSVIIILLIGSAAILFEIARSIYNLFY